MASAVPARPDQASIPELRAALEETGLASLPGAVAPEAALEMRQRIWSFAAEHLGVEHDTPDTWRPLRPSRMRPLHKADAFAAMASSRVRTVLDELLGAGRWHEPPHWGQLLLSFPGEGPWIVPHKIWHLDFMAPHGSPPLPGVQLFLFLDRVAPRGGGTVAISGCHRLVASAAERAGPSFPACSEPLRRALGRSVPWLRDLWTASGEGDRVRRFMEESAEHDGIPLRVVELTGEPGDMLLMHPWIFHAPARNCGARARMVLTERIHARA